MPIFLVLIAVPLAEIATFIIVGGKIGVFATLLGVLATATAGAILLRNQGLAVINRIRDDLARDRMPARPLADAAMIAAAGLLLLTPGFLTDSMGLMLFVPPVRDWIWRKGVARFGEVQVHSQSSHRSTNEPPVIDLNEGDYETRGDGESPWQPRDKS